MSIQTARTTDEGTFPQSQGHQRARAIAAENRYSRQLAAIIWIVLAWVAGTIVFEITAIGGEPKHVVIETDDKPVTLFFHDQKTDLLPSEGANADK